jgi:deoxycytidylate deaminase
VAERPLLFGPCAKRRTQAILTGRSGAIYIAENSCLNPQPVCPRLPGEGYEKCKTVCQQVEHAEIQVLAAAGDDAREGAMTVTHWYACPRCEAACGAAGVKSVTCIGPQNTERTQ